MSKGKASAASLEAPFQNLAIGAGSNRAPTNAPRGHTAVDPSSGAETRWELGQPNQSGGSSVRSYDPKRVLALENRKDQQVLKGSFSDALSKQFSTCSYSYKLQDMLSAVSPRPTTKEAGLVYRPRKEIAWF